MFPNPNNPDSSGDGLTDGQEVDSVGTDPTEEGTDSDGLTDGQEVDTNGTDPLKVASFLSAWTPRFCG